MDKLKALQKGLAILRKYEIQFLIDADGPLLMFIMDEYGMEIIAIPHKEKLEKMGWKGVNDVCFTFNLGDE